MDRATVAAATVAALSASPEFALMISASVEALAAKGSATPALPTTTAPPRHQGGNVAPSSGSTGAPSGDSVHEQRIEDLTKQVAAMAAAELIITELITELTRQAQEQAAAGELADAEGGTAGEDWPLLGTGPPARAGPVPICSPPLEGRRTAARRRKKEEKTLAAAATAAAATPAPAALVRRRQRRSRRRHRCCRRCRRSS